MRKEEKGTVLCLQIGKCQVKDDKEIIIVLFNERKMSV